MDFFKKTKGEAIFRLDGKQLKQFVKALEESECTIVLPDKEEVPRLELNSLRSPEKPPLVYELGGLKKSYLKQVLCRCEDDSLSILSQVELVGRLNKLVSENRPPKDFEEIVDKPDSDEQDSWQQSSSASGPGRRAVREVDEVKRTLLRMNVLEILRCNNELTPSEMRRLLEQEKGVHEPESSIRQIMKEFCEGRKSKRGGMAYILKKDYRAEGD